MNLIDIDIKNADMATFERLHALFTRIEAERNPEDPPASAEQVQRRWQNTPDFVKLKAWAIASETDAAFLASAWAIYLDTGDNPHLMQVMISVLPEWRRQGLGRRLLAQMCAYVRSKDRQLLLFMTNTRIPAGAAFMQAMGASMGLESRPNELRLSDVKPDLLQSWLAAGQKLESQYSLTFWASPYTEEQIADALLLHELGNQAPRENLDIEDFIITPDLIRQSDAGLIASGQQRWTAVVHERRTGCPVGFTELILERERPALIHQGLTGIFPEFRNQGIGRWLKAAMLDRVLREWPQGRVIRTGNAGSNAPMLKINSELGFRADHVDQAWQVDVEQAGRFALVR